MKHFLLSKRVGAIVLACALGFAAACDPTPEVEIEGDTPEIMGEVEPTEVDEEVAEPIYLPGLHDIYRVRVNTWSTADGTFDFFTPTALFDNNGATGWHGNWGTGSGEISPEEAILDIDLGATQDITRIELDKRNMSNERATINAVSLYVFEGDADTWPNSEVTFPMQFREGIAQEDIDADFVMDGWVAVATTASVEEALGATTDRTMVITLDAPVEARYIRLVIETIDAATGDADMPQIAEARVFGEAVEADVATEEADEEAAEEVAEEVVVEEATEEVVEADEEEAEELEEVETVEDEDDTEEAADEE